MDLILNELSVKGLSPNPVELGEAVDKIIAMRNAAKDRAGVEVYCLRNVSNMAVSSGESFRARLQFLHSNKKRAMFKWLDKHGPYREYDPMRDSSEWYECDGERVNQTGLAEAARCVENGNDWRTLSFAPSIWERSPITVMHRWKDDGGMSRDISVPNYWNMVELESALTEAEPKPKKWKDVEETARRRFTNLIFTAGSFSDMNGRPFTLGVAERILIRLNVLNRICNAGPNSPEGVKLLNDHFGHTKSWFSNTTGPQINKFRKKLTFPVDGVDTLCPWHGKVKTPPYRIHFTWPISDGKVHVVYVGWKITVH